MTLTQKLKSYLSDWKNLATHAIVGIMLMAVIFIIPVHIHFRISILFSVVIINIIRMRVENAEEPVLEDESSLI
ncbi:MAG: hypothetical protein BAJATHORv1_60104 [Candidatus Thorarchaeota archaeon]|nr:MAG: hypothetical protein BAJATHORv1_60104 [Candidatus Thorarchaeota archaeon]